MGESGLRLSRRTFLGGVAALGIFSLVDPLAAFAAPTAAEKQAEADAVRVQVDAFDADRIEKENAYGAALDVHDQAVISMEETQVKIDETNTQISDLQDKLGTRARGMYRSGSTTFLDLLFGSSSFHEFATNWDLLNKMNEEDAVMVGDTKVLREELQSLKDDYADQEKLAADKAEEARVAKIAAEKTVQEYRALLDSLDEEVRQLIIQEQEAAAAAAAAAEIARQERAVQSNGNGGASSNSGSGNSGGGNASDYGPPAGDMVSEAEKYIGVPYVSGGTSPAGFDCSGLVYYCCQRVGRRTPPRTTYNYPSGGGFPVSQAQPGDILWCESHVAICTSSGGGSYIHASMSRGQVCYGSYPQFTRAYRF